ncbi:hypothetical protein BO71DRAFT_396314 [Aspergillus ellipticus CBS 707.79]|uniref:Uncharacterized protein n=1 Tax=Aspergillus ellipticus CBS 707.79 TaxID=1448320 RepID=A0A319E9H3_9EURO|nr:hypothetical protein BO71DRAFT_396314 [Aspergillus ellipticus CBS 707.79]
MEGLARGYGHMLVWGCGCDTPPETGLKARGFLVMDSHVNLPIWPRGAAYYGRLFLENVQIILCNPF